jgi:hypothetical protein
MRCLGCGQEFDFPEPEETEDKSFLLEHPYIHLREFAFDAVQLFEKMCYDGNGETAWLVFATCCPVTMLTNDVAKVVDYFMQHPEDIMPFWSKTIP